MVRRPGRAVDDAVVCLLRGPGDEPVQVQLGRPGHAEVLEQDRVAARLRRDAGFAALGSRGATPASSRGAARVAGRSEEHTSELQSLMRISYAVFCLKKKKKNKEYNKPTTQVH